MTFLISDYYGSVNRVTIDDLYDVLVEREHVEEHDALKANLWAKKAQDGDVYECDGLTITAVVEVE